MRKMLLSFKPEVYEKIKSGKKKFEHRRNFPDEPIMAYMYVSAPIKAIKGIVYLGKRHLLSDWREEFKNDKAAVVRIEKYQELYRYAMEINEFQETTEISLGALRRDVSGFVAPQMYIYLDGTELLDYIENKIENLDEVNNDTEILFYVNSMSWYLVPYLSLDLKRAYFTTGTTPEQMEYLVEQLQPDMVIAILL